MNTGAYFHVAPDLELYYEAAGVGSPIVFIPGWAGNTAFYKHQIPYFVQSYRTITFDPRSQGRSSKTPERNHYTQHGADLKALLDGLQLNDVVLVGLSWGCLDIYAYLRAYGPANLKACVFIDEMPKPLGTDPTDWVDMTSYAEGWEFVRAVSYDFQGLLTTMLPPMMKRDMRGAELDWLIEQLRQTPVYAAALLAVDAIGADYTQEAMAIDGVIPVLNVVSEDQAERARTWLGRHAPHAELAVLGKHLMLLEFPDEFNAIITNFLAHMR